MDRQAVFNQVRDHLLAQGVRSEDPKTGQCRYRGPDGLKCAIGAIVSDAHYDEQMDLGNLSACSRTVLDAVGDSIACYVEDWEARFLRELQEIHDDDDPATWRYTLDRFAQSWGLQP